MKEGRKKEKNYLCFGYLLTKNINSEERLSKPMKAVSMFKAQAALLLPNVRDSLSNQYHIPKLHRRLTEKIAEGQQIPYSLGIINTQTTFPRVMSSFQPWQL